MDKAQREALEAHLSEELDTTVIVNELMPPNAIYLFDMSNNPDWHEETLKWVAVPAGVASMPNASEVVKSAILRNARVKRPLVMFTHQELESLKLPD